MEHRQRSQVIFQEKFLKNMRFMEKKSNKKNSVIQHICIGVCIAFSLVIFFSPYGNNHNYPYPVIEESIIIEMPVESVFDYLGDSDNAANWSVFVNQIETINQETVSDGSEGSVRRCFVQEDKKGMQWDEEIVEVIPNEKRQLTIFNLVDFPMVAENLATEQIYERRSENHCKVTFTLFFKDRLPSYLESLKMYIAAYQVKSIFKANMENIKRLVEKKKRKV